MTSKFLEELEKGTNYTLTENYAKTNISSFNPVLDYFALAGAMRNNLPGAADLFAKAYISDPQLAVRALFYMRDIRGGQGERDVFYTGLLVLKQLDEKVYNQVIKFIPEYGRWSDILIGGVTDEVVEIVRNQLDADYASMEKEEPVSLMAKWLPSENTSSDKSKEMARQLAKGLGITAAEYRRTVVKLRKYIRLLEQNMSANDWAAIEYEKLPSQAFRKHTKAFKRHDEARFTSFLDAAEKGEAKLNTSTLFTYEVFDAVERGELQAANAMWNNLPDYTQGRNALVVADVSGSMFWFGTPKPISISVSLALYFAERNEGPFKDYFMTFTSQSQLVKVEGKTLAEKIRFIQSADWGGSTNIQSAFNAILRAAINANASQDEMPSTLYIISDMEFDVATQGNNLTNFQAAEKKFAEAGYQLPHLVFWNVQARNTQVPATKHDDRVSLISGFSQSTFRYAVEGKKPEELMFEILNGERYSQIVVQ